MAVAPFLNESHLFDAPNRNCLTKICSRRRQVRPDAAAAEICRWLERNTRTTITKTKNVNDVAHAMWWRATAQDGMCETAERRRDADRRFADPNPVTLGPCSTPEFTTSSHVTLRTDRHARDGAERIRSHGDDGTRSQQSLHPTRADGIVSAGG